MIPTPAQFAEIQKGHADALNAYGHALFNGAERLMQLNLATGKAMLRESTAAAQSLAAVKDPQEIMALTQAGAQPAMEKIVSYARSVQGIASAIGSELSKIAETQVAEGNRQLAEFVDSAAKSAPAGTESAVAWLKNTVAAANTAYDSINRATQQAVEATESNIAAVSAAAGEAVKPRNRKVA